MCPSMWWVRLFRTAKQEVSSSFGRLKNESCAGSRPEGEELSQGPRVRKCRMGRDIAWQWRRALWAVLHPVLQARGIAYLDFHTGEGARHVCVSRDIQNHSQ